jgi:hypothetical protein
MHGFSDIISDTVDVEATDRNEESPLELAARIGPASTVLPFITAGQIDHRPGFFFFFL